MLKSAYIVEKKTWIFYSMFAKLKLYEVENISLTAFCTSTIRIYESLVIT